MRRVRYSVFATDGFLSQQVFRKGTWGKLQHALTQILVKGFEAPVVLDIGANFGLYAVPVASMVSGFGGKVLAFEPQRIVFQQLCANIFLMRRKSTSSLTAIKSTFLASADRTPAL